MEQTVQAFKSCLIPWTGNVQLCTICGITFLVDVVGGP